MPKSTSIEPDARSAGQYYREVRFQDLVTADRPPTSAQPAERTPVTTDSYANAMLEDPRNNGFVTGLFDRKRANRMHASRRGFLRGTIAAAAATTTATALNVFGPARRVAAQTGVVGTYPRRILQFCPPYNSGDNCQPGCGSSPICTDCCGADGFFRNDPANGYSLYAGGCGDGDIADGWLWRYSGKCGSCAEIEYRCSDGYVQTDTGPAPFICRAVTDCVPLADGEEAGPALADAARDTNWRPAGALEVAVDQGGSVAISGWIADGTGVPVQMRIRANNQIIHLGSAALTRNDIAARVPGAGANVGFAVSFPIAPGEYEFCVDALEGVLNARIGCVRMNVGSGATVRGSGSTGSIAPPPTTASDPGSQSSPNPTPAPTPGAIVMPDVDGRSKAPVVGAVQVIRRSGQTTGFVSGWAGDADTDEAVFIDVRVDGASVSTTRTDLPRPDVTGAFGVLSNTTGFAVSFSLPEDEAEVCVVAASADDGREQPLGCQVLGAAEPDASVDAPTDDTDDGAPTASGSANGITSTIYGGIDSVTVTNTGFRVSGWAFDPNERGRDVRVTATASGVTSQVQVDNDHEQAQRRYGLSAPAGFVVDVETAAGIYDLVVTADTSDGQPVTLGSQTVIVP